MVIAAILPKVFLPFDKEYLAWLEITMGELLYWRLVESVVANCK